MYLYIDFKIVILYNYEKEDGNLREWGETFRLLRKERDFTLKSMAEGIISFSYLSKFEQGKSDITLNNFIRLIERLNITLDEFLFVNHVSTTHYVELFHSISLAYAKNDKITLQNLLTEERNIYEESGIIYHKCNFIMIAAIIQDINESFFIPQSDIDFLVDYIVKCSFWTAYEVSLLGNSLTLFSDDLLLVLLNEVTKRLKEYKVSRRNIRDLIALIENACFIFLRRKNVTEARLLSNLLDSFLEPSYFFEKTRKFFIDGIIYIYEGKREEGIEKAKQAIEIMGMMDKEFADDHRVELSNFLELIK